MSFSTAYAPPAGSATAATCDSSISSAQVLRAIRRPKASGRPSGAVERQHGDGVGAADARRERGDRGAEHVHPGVVLAHHRPAGDGVLVLLADGSVPLSSSTRAQSRRAARSLAIVGELLVGRGVAELDELRRLVDDRTRRRSARAGSARRPPATQPSSCASDAPRSCTSVASTTKPSTPASIASRAASSTVALAASMPRLVPRVELATGRRTQEAARRGDLGRPSAQDHRREVEQDTGRAGRGSPCRSSASSQSEVAPPSRSASDLSLRSARVTVRAEARMSQAPARVGRPLVAEPVEEVGRAERRDRDAVERRVGQRRPDRVVGVVVGEPARLAQHGAAARSQSDLVQPSSADASASAPGSGSSSSGSSSPPATSVMASG